MAQRTSGSGTTRSRGASERPGARSSAKKAAVKKAPEKKTSATRAAARKPVTKKAPAKKTVAKKTPAKKAPAKKAPAKKAVAKKTPVKKPVKQSTAKTATKKAPAKKAPAKKAATKQAAAKAPAKQAPAKQAAPAKPQVPLKKAATTPKKSARGRKPLTPAERDEMRGVLRAERVRLKAEIATAVEDLNELLRDSGDGSGDDQADAGSKTFEREHEMSVANNSRDLLQQVEHALKRISDGTYGTCESCGLPIGKMRLEAFPRATLCVDCKQREERR
jgi:RNA polymerase-binding protein DksA